MERPAGKSLDRQALQQWLHSPRGARLRAQEAREVGRLLPDLFGRHLLQIGSWSVGEELIARSEMLHRAVLGTVPGQAAQSLVEAERLPLPANAVDAVLLAHVMEFARSPQSVLREVNRVLTERGRLLVLGFNPWSLWGARRWLGLRHRDFPAGARFISARRLCDWLELLDFQVTELRRFAVGAEFPVAHSQGEGFSPASLVAPFSGAYLVVAKKRVVPLSLMRRPARPVVRPLIGGAVPIASQVQTRDAENPQRAS